MQSKAIFALLLVAAACGDDDGTADAGCVEGRTLPCTCPDDSLGTQTCGEDGRFDTCACGATDGGTDALVDADGGMADGPTGCDPAPPDPPLHMCSPATRDCVRACGDVPCIEACIAADPAPEPCGQCLNSLRSAFDACVVEMGCEESWSAYVCCIEAECPDFSCDVPGGPCDEAYITFNDCAAALLPACEGRAALCYP